MQKILFLQGNITFQLSFYIREIIQEQLMDDFIIEWRDYYIDNTYLNNNYLDRIEHIYQKFINEKESIQRYTYKIQIAELDRQFQEQLQNQVDQTLQFFEIQLQDTNRNIDLLHDGIKEYFEIKNSKLLISINQDFIELERTLNLLKTFLQQNTDVFRLIVKRHDLLSQQIEEFGQLQTQLIDFFKHKRTYDIDMDKNITKLSNMFSQLINSSSEKAQKYLFQHSKIQSNVPQKQRIFNYFNGLFSGLFLVCTIKTIVTIIFLLNNKFNKEQLDKLQLVSFRVCFIIGLSIFSQSIVQMICEHRINYTFLLELPTNKVTVGYRKTLQISMFYLIITEICFILHIISYTTLIGQADIQQIFSNNIIKLASLLKPIYWTCIPVWTFTFVSIVTLIQIACGHQQVLKTLYKNYIQLFDIKNPITFYSYIIADLLTSYYLLMGDIVNLITFGINPPWLVFIFQITFPTLRILQQFRKYVQSKHVHPYITNSIKYILSIPACAIVFYDLGFKKKELFWFCFVLETMTVLVKIYWEIVQDAGLLSGGVGSLEFKNQKNKWKHKFFIRRSSQLPTWFAVLFIIVNVVVRFLFIVEYIFAEEFHIISCIIIIELFRRTLWLIYRLDNQQATNCEHYTATRFIPITLQKTTLQYARQHSQVRKESLQNINRDRLAQIDISKYISDTSVSE